MVIVGPDRAAGVSEAPGGAAVFSCTPDSAAEARPCAERIIARLAPAAFRRPVSADETQALLGFYDEGAAAGDFAMGVRTALEAMLASPHFVFRFEEPAQAVAAGEPYPIGDSDLAARLSFFLWGAPPDAALAQVAAEGRLSDPAALDREAQRLLADPRSDALGTRFAAQWLRLQDLEKIHPDVRIDPDYHLQLAADMRRETEAFFNSLVREDRSLLDLYDADYTFLNERLARHYGVDGVTGSQLRKVQYMDERRRGILGHASVLTMTSHAGRTSPVLRGKWGHGGPPRSPAAAAATGRTRSRRGRGGCGRTLAHDARTDGGPPGQPYVQFVPPIHRSDRARARQLRCFREVEDP